MRKLKTGIENLTAKFVLAKAAIKMFVVYENRGGRFDADIYLSSG